MLTVPATFLIPALLAWLLIILTGKSTPPLHAHSRRSLLWLVLATALAVSALNASPFGPYKSLASAVWSLVIFYPAWLILSALWLLPGIALCRRYSLSPLRFLPLTAMAIELSMGAVGHWPPTRWWPIIFTGGIPQPSGYLAGIPIEAWEGYLYSLWAQVFEALFAALFFLIAIRFVRPNYRVERRVDDKVPSSSASARGAHAER